jgi:hypothetical protein
VKLPFPLEGKGLSEVEDLYKSSSGPVRVDRMRSRRDLQLESAGGGDPRQRVGAGFPVTAQVGVDDRAGQTGAPRDLGLGEAASTEDLVQERGRGRGHRI